VLPLLLLTFAAFCFGWALDADEEDDPVFKD